MAKFPSPSGGLGGITLGDKHKKTIIAFLEKHVAGDPVMDKVFEGVLPYLSEQPLVVIGQTEPVPAQDPMAEPGLEGGAPAAEEAAPPAEKKPAAKEKAEKKPPKATEKKAQSEHFWAGFR